MPKTIIVTGGCGYIGSHVARAFKRADPQNRVHIIDRVKRDHTLKDIEAVKEVFGKNLLVCGFYSYGEISPTLSNVACELHNQTMTISTLYES